MNPPTTEPVYVRCPLNKCGHVFELFEGASPLACPQCGASTAPKDGRCREWKHEEFVLVQIDPRTNPHPGDEFEGRRVLRRTERDVYFRILPDGLPERIALRTWQRWATKDPTWKPTFHTAGLISRLIPHATMNRNPYPTDRRAASPKRKSDVTPSKHPVMTQAAYQAMLGREGDPNMNIELRKLAMGRIRLGQTLLALDLAVKAWPITKNAKLYQRLEQIYKNVSKLYLSYPLEIMNK